MSNSNRRGYARLKNDFYSNVKVRKIVRKHGYAPVGLFCAAICYCAANNTGGQISEDELLYVLDGDEVDVNILVSETLLAPSPDARNEYIIQDYLVPEGNPRRPIPKALRQAVYERDHYTCQQCGATKHLSLDHIRPYSKGGQDTMENLKTLCRSCNSRKGARIEERN